MFEIEHFEIGEHERYTTCVYLEDIQLFAIKIHKLFLDNVC